MKTWKSPWKSRSQHLRDNEKSDAGRGDTQEEMDAYNDFNAFGEGMDNPVAP